MLYEMEGNKSRKESLVPMLVTEKKRKPSWLKVKAPSGDKYLEIKGLMEKLNLATVCQEARCPNLGECWGGGTATIMIMGDTCTRGCRFCSVKTGKLDGELDLSEPDKVALSLSQLDLDYVVVTSVDRDDLEDLGSGHFSKTVRRIKELSPNMLVEVLAPDFNGTELFIKNLLDAQPDVYAHNIETVERLTPRVRDRRASYLQSIDVLALVKKLAPQKYTKTSIMLGLGETDFEVLQTLKDLRSVGCDVVTFGQYLQPTKLKLKVESFISPEKFDEWAEKAKEMGFLYVASGPLVRSSYRAGEYFMKALLNK